MPNQLMPGPQNLWPYRHFFCPWSWCQPKPPVGFQPCWLLVPDRWYKNRRGFSSSTPDDGEILPQLVDWVSGLEKTVIDGTAVFCKTLVWGMGVANTPVMKHLTMGRNRHRLQRCWKPKVVSHSPVFFPEQGKQPLLVLCKGRHLPKTIDRHWGNNCWNWRKTGNIGHHCRSGISMLRQLLMQWQSFATSPRISLGADDSLRGMQDKERCWLISRECRWA